LELQNWHRSQRRLENSGSGREGEERMAEGGHREGLWVGVLLVLGVIVSVHGMQEECAVEIYDMIFKPTLGQLKTPYAMVEFFVSW